MSTVFVLASIFGGAVLQRLTGMGFAIVAAPLLALVLGPTAGVVMVIICGTAAAVALTATHRRGVDLTFTRPLAIGAAIGVAPGALLRSLLDARTLMIGIGVATLASLVVVLLAARTALPGAVPPPGTATKVGVGTAAGAVNMLAGVGGVPLSAFSVRVNWALESFVPSVQPVFVVMGIVSLGALAAGTDTSWPTLHAAVWAGAAVAMSAGLAAGAWLADRLPARIPPLAMVTVSTVSAVVAITRGFSMP